MAQVIFIKWQIAGFNFQSWPAFLYTSITIGTSPYWIADTVRMINPGRGKPLFLAQENAFAVAPPLPMSDAPIG